MEKLTSIEAYQSAHERQDTKETIFQTLIIDEIINAFEQDLEDLDFDQNTIHEFEEEIGKLDEESIKGILSTPKELRLRNFTKYLKDIETSISTPAEIISNLAQIAKKNGYTLGYHVTNNKILKTPDTDEWNIIGTEVDDRDDRAMAYYSLTYTDIYRADRRKYLYVVRASTGPETEHKRDTSNNWGRASTLAIVHEIDLLKIDEQVEHIYQVGKEELKKDAA